jgi:hypothetical protein
MNRRLPLFRKSLQRLGISVEHLGERVKDAIDPSTSPNEDGISETSTVRGDVEKKCSIHGLSLFVHDESCIHDSFSD